MSLSLLPGHLHATLQALGARGPGNHSGVDAVVHPVMHPVMHPVIHPVVHPLIRQALHVPVPAPASLAVWPAWAKLSLAPGADPDRWVAQACVLALMLLPFLL